MKELLVRLLNTDTQNPPGNERILADLIAEYLKDAPVETTLQTVAPGRANLISLLRGKKAGGKLILNGHLDTVPYGGGWISDPGRAAEKDGRIYARGASDMKSGLAALLFAFRAFARSGEAPERDILFAATCDEESSGLGAEAFARAGYLNGASAVVIGEPSGNGIGLFSKGCLWLRAAFGGRISHGAYPEQGINALEAAMRFAYLVKALLREEAHPRLGRASATVTGLSGGVKVNMLPDAAELLMDIRTLPGTDHARLRAQIDGAARRMEAQAEGLKVSLCFENDRAPMQTPPEAEIARLLARAAEKELGAPPETVGSAFFSDASVFLRYAKPDIVLFGPGESRQAHTANESVSLRAYKSAVRIVQTLIASYGQRS